MDLAVLAIDQIGHFAQILLSRHLVHQLEQGGLPFEDHDVVGNVEETGTAAKIVD